MSNTIKVVIYGAHGVGKTTLLDSLPQDTTLVISAEAGLNCVPHWNDKDCIITARDWPTTRAIAACVTPPDPAAIPGKPYSTQYQAKALAAIKTDKGIAIDTGRYTDLFVDSITVLSRICRKWAETQPDNITSNGKVDMRKVYGMVADEMLAFFHQLQFAPLNVWIVGAMDRVVSDMGEVTYEPALEGAKTGKRLIGIVDDVVTLAILDVKKGDATEKRRVFVTHFGNPWNYPAKTRSNLKMIEPAHLGLLSEKIKNAPKERVIQFDETPVELDQIIY